MHGAVGGSVFKIVPAFSYPSDYDEIVKQEKQEQDSDYRHPLVAKVDNFEFYAVFFVGSPIWRSSIASPIKTFLSQYDWTGKTVDPFSTHGGMVRGKALKILQNSVHNRLFSKVLQLRRKSEKLSDWCF
ncbi:flavodoxin [Sporolactobacillus sp. KGMB 08714]|uniref:flavodoxin n=1 Tax=Sporolactobacillus sp. KGMB 08714 TaxID=3064704 RepID=UPI003FA7E778